MGRNPVPVERLPLRGAPAEAVALSRLEWAGVPVIERRFRPGEPVYLRGDADRGLCFLLEGTLRVYKTYGGSAEATVRLLAGGGLFGEPSLRAGGRHRDSAEALSACRVTRVPKGTLETHLRRDPGCSFPLLLALAGWAEEREAAAARLVPWEVCGRLARLLLELSERFGRETGRGTEVGLRLTHHDLARMVACTREAVTKEMSRFRRAGLTEARGRCRVVLLDESRLADLARAGSARGTVYSTA